VRFVLSDPAKLCECLTAFFSEKEGTQCYPVLVMHIGKIHMLQ
jgi:hypothetical protein